MQVGKAVNIERTRILSKTKAKKPRYYSCVKKLENKELRPVTKGDKNMLNSKAHPILELAGAPLLLTQGSARGPNSARAKMRMLHKSIVTAKFFRPSSLYDPTRDSNQDHYTADNRHVYNQNI